MTQRFADKVLLVTGGSSGIGLAVARRLAEEGASVVIGARGAEATPLYRGLLGVGPRDDLGRAPNPTGRTATPAELAAFVAFLLSDEAKFITGAALPIDGGSTAG